MNRLQKISVLAMFAIFLGHTYAFAQNKKAYNIDNSNIALQGYSPVSYLDLGLAQKGIKTFRSTHNKVVYYFTSAKQKAKFDQNPQRYLPQYGGYCAFGIYAGAKFRPNPHKFIVKDGKYFLYLYNLELDAQQLWLAEKNHKKLVKKANQNWSKLRATYN